ncbi:FAD-dependent monooxygenase [Algirhabdus cladophorae]|uniref:FAD-dependent monooxygenase n=1 Tax=Algirhabdus cladophorae TaxID=3377108 RepID=UPI003B84A3DD
MTPKILIAGAGLGGLSAALALRQIGCEVAVYEAASTLGEVGAGIQLSPNAMHVLRHLGLEDQIVQAGYAPQFAAMRHWSTGKTLFSSPLNPVCVSRYGAPYVHIHRADAHQILTQAAQAAGVQITTGAPVTGYNQTSEAIALKVKGGSVEGDLLIGADGIKSRIRDQMLGPQKARFTGQVAWRALVPATSVPRDLLAPGVTVWVGPDRHVVMYYVRGGNLINLVAVEERSDWTQEGWSHQGDPADLQDRFAGWHPDVAQVLDACETVHLWALFDRPSLPHWHQGRAVLLGDACHPTLPFMAQGACLAIEDAGVLANSIHSASDLTAALSQYETRRKPRATALQTRARDNADLFHLRMSALTKAKLSVGRLLPPVMRLKALDAVYGYRFDRP